MDLYPSLESTVFFEKIFFFVRAGGNILIPLIVLSGIMWLLIINRFLTLLFIESKTRELAPLDTIAAMKQRQGKANEKEFDISIKTTKRRLKKNFNLIKQCISIAPLLGLLGTVTGMIEVFEVLKIYGAGNSILIGKGFSHATIPTMFGLTVAISGSFTLILLESLALKKIRLSKETI